MKKIAYHNFPQKVKSFVRDYFRVDGSELSSLYISQENRPKEYPNFICAEFIPPHKIAYYNDKINWSGIIHDVTHFMQYRRDKEGFLRDKEVVKTAAINNYGVYRENEWEKEAFKAQEEFEKYSFDKLSWKELEGWNLLDNVKDSSILQISFKNTYNDFPYFIYIERKIKDEDKDMFYFKGFLNYGNLPLLKYNIINSTSSVIHLYKREIENVKFIETIQKDSSQKLSWKLQGEDQLYNIREGQVWKVFKPDDKFYKLSFYIVATEPVVIQPSLSGFEKELRITGYHFSSLSKLIKSYYNKKVKPWTFILTGKHRVKNNIFEDLEYQYIGDIEDLAKNKKLSWKDIPQDLTGWLVQAINKPTGYVYYGVIKNQYKDEEDTVYEAAWFRDEDQALSKHYLYLNRIPRPITDYSYQIIPIRKINLDKEANFNSYKDQNRSMYRNRLQYYNEDEGANIFWSSKDAQEKRFKALTDIGNLNDTEVLDVGCGYVDFLDFLNKEKIKVRKYTGVDIVPEIVKKARELHPNTNIEVRDIQEEPIKENSFDYVFGSGIFALEDQNWQQYVVNMLKEMLKISRKGVGVNFLKQPNMNRLSWASPQNVEEVTGWLVEDLDDKVGKRYGVINKVRKHGGLSKYYTIFANWSVTESDAIKSKNERDYNNTYVIVSADDIFKRLKLIMYIGFDEINNKKLSWKEPTSTNLLGWLVSTNYDPSKYTNKVKENRTWYGVVIGDDKDTVAAKWATRIKDAIDNFKTNGYHIIPADKTGINFVDKDDITVIKQVHLPKPSRLKNKKLSWQEPKSLKGWLVKAISKKDKSEIYAVIYSVSPFGDYYRIWYGKSEETALKNIGRKWVSNIIWGNEWYIQPLYKVDLNKEANINQLMQVDPNFTLNFIRNFVTNKVILKEGYLEDDFTIFCYKE